MNAKTALRVAIVAAIADGIHAIHRATRDTVAAQVNKFESVRAVFIQAAELGATEQEVNRGLSEANKILSRTKGKSTVGPYISQLKASYLVGLDMATVNSNQANKAAKAAKLELYVEEGETNADWLVRVEKAIQAEKDATSGDLTDAEAYASDTPMADALAKSGNGDKALPLHIAELITFLRQEAATISESDASRVLAVLVEKPQTVRQAAAA